jgi:hypothetical protein
MFKDLRTLLQQARIGQSRSSVINPLQWVLLILVFATLSVVVAHGPDWLVKLFAGFVALTLVGIIFVYIYFMFTDSDALRSEKYSLVKTAIQKHPVGDSLSGVRDMIETFEDTNSAMVPADKSKNVMDIGSE